MLQILCSDLNALQNGLVISALCGDLGKGFHDPAKNPELIEESKLILDLAKELETNIVTTHIGVVPSDPANERYQIMQEACFKLAQYAAKSTFPVPSGSSVKDGLASISASTSP